VVPNDRSDKFVDDGSGFTWDEPPCDTCRHKFAGQRGCAAFPDQIPTEIITGKNDHRSPYPGDQGIQYAPIEARTP
jgi:hypothetical protein